MSFQAFGSEELQYLREVIESQQIWRGTAGNFASRFEDAFAAHAGRQYVHALASGTGANEAALAGVGVGPGDEVIVSPCSFIASSIAPVGLGGVPVFADVDPRLLVLTAETIEAALTPKAKAVVVVHLWGQPAEIGPIVELCRARGLKLIEDCAQAYDAYYHGQKVGTFGDATCYSLQQSKHVTSGEGGIVTTDDPEVYERAVLYCNCGMPWYRYGLEWPKPEPCGDLLTRGHFAFGHNLRISELQAAVALAQLEKVDGFNARRAEIAEAIESELRDVPGVALAHRYDNTQPNYWAYPLRSTELTTAELAPLCRERQDYGLPRYAEINYLEVVYQQMQATRATSVGYPLPDYVQYQPGICPQAEEGARHLIPMHSHPAADPEDLRAAARKIRLTLAAA